MSSTPTPEQQAALIAAGISPTLVPLVEFVEEDGSRVAVCDPECGTTRWMSDTRTWAHCAVMGRGYGASDTYWRNSVACYKCRAILSILPDGTPYRIRHSRSLAALEQAQAERDHLRRALEWLANRKAGAIGAGGGQDFEIDCGQRKGRAKNAEDWAAAALAATEEVMPPMVPEGAADALAGVYADKEAAHRRWVAEEHADTEALDALAEEATDE